MYLMAIESNNHIWGRALNPWNKERTSGGSSGGEGGLIASRCSPIGVGSDVGGSLRIPALYCGVYALKPSTKRMSVLGHACMEIEKGENRLNFRIITGPIGKCVDDLALYLRAMYSEKMWEKDPTVPPIPFDETVYRAQGRLRIGYFETEEFLGVAKANRRAIREAAEALRKAGHEVFEVRYQNMRKRC
eukprot:TRINITY_DN4933_c0_g1_i2.p1 TRINITY_DN4933_c0_g1~~TRINITY_DN4933_c0_g1_i2.p1  ORF type:complete len:189 (+),score=19.26 TRINITY_DN4933_c0_g1_i2:600-1166(+)